MERFDALLLGAVGAVLTAVVFSLVALQHFYHGWPVL